LRYDIILISSLLQLLFLKHTVHKRYITEGIIFNITPNPDPISVGWLNIVKSEYTPYFVFLNNGLPKINSATLTFTTRK
ncbi:hypothetical protein, partial [Escherichia coli]|uniref:hypothetical protein n=1 Tax=Escherichia coli TaxID=562 RepID=UPI001BC830D4